MKDSSSKTRNIEHPDISKLTDSELVYEINYYRDYIPEILDKIYARSETITAGYEIAALSIPSRKLVSDLNFGISRVEAISEEIQYRAKMMR